MKHKRLIDSRKKLTFKNWVKQHNPTYPWDFDNPHKLMTQLCGVISETGDIDIKTIFVLMATEELKTETTPFVDMDY